MYGTPRGHLVVSWSGVVRREVFAKAFFLPVSCQRGLEITLEDEEVGVAPASRLRRRAALHP